MAVQSDVFQFPLKQLYDISVISFPVDLSPRHMTSRVGSTPYFLLIIIWTFIFLYFALSVNQIFVDGRVTLRTPALFHAIYPYNSAEVVLEDFVGFISIYSPWMFTPKSNYLVCYRTLLLYLTQSPITSKELSLRNTLMILDLGQQIYRK